ncbi:MAG: hypothetical protein M3433_05205 [Actinomycetota bacterium]|nr:hypothetical protein [Actinomycetota bacterium]
MRKSPPTTEAAEREHVLEEELDGSVEAGGVGGGLGAHAEPSAFFERPQVDMS